MPDDAHAGSDKYRYIEAATFSARLLARRVVYERNCPPKFSLLNYRNGLHVSH